MATAGSIGADLDSVDVYSVVRIGFSTSILEMAQEMGRCNRGINKSNSLVTDDFHLLLSCQDFVYLNQRLCQPQPSLPAVKAIMTAADEIRMQRENLLELLKMSVLKGDCWHKQTEDIL